MSPSSLSRNLPSFLRGVPPSVAPCRAPTVTSTGRLRDKYGTRHGFLDDRIVVPVSDLRLCS
jgi:hypothetical protein